MLNLYDYLTPLDSKRIENYITEWGIEDGYVGNDTYLSYWKENNINLIRIPYWHYNDLCLDDLLVETSKFIVRETDEVTLD